MPLIRGHHDFDDHFAQIPNAWLRDQRLSFRARGVLAMIMTHQPGWQLSIESIARENQEGKDAIRGAIKELEAFGYLVRYQPNNGRFSEAVWKTQDPSTPLAVIPTTEKPTTEKPTPKNTIYQKTITKNYNPEYVDGFIAFWAIYPRKTGKREAARAFDLALTKVPLETLLDAVQRFANDPNLPEAQFVPHAATWLNQERWEDDPLPERAISKEELAERQRRAEAEKWERIRLATERETQEMEELAKYAAPPPKCPHGEAIVHCKKCLYANG